jgi:nucleotide-binding universal stress UspA family protein
MAHLFRRILVPHDFSDPATAALRVAAGLAGAKGRLAVLHVVTPFQPVTGMPMAEAGVWIPPAEIVAEEKKSLEKLVARTLRGRGAPRAECRVEIGDPFQRIMDAARRADTIVMATAGRTGLAHLLIGSVAEKVVRHAPIPVLTVRPRPARGRRGRGRGRRAAAGS